MSLKVLDEIWASNTPDVRDPVCDLTAIFKDIKILDSTTASSTIQVLATLANKSKSYEMIRDYVRTTGEDKVFVKIGFDETGDNSADIERMIYKYLSGLLLQHRTPNIMRYVASFKCDHFIDFLKGQKGSKHKAYHTGMLERVEELVELEADLGLDGNKATITLIELGKGKPFKQILKDDNLTEDQFRSVMFQTFYTLREFHLNKIRHNDIHLG